MRRRREKKASRDKTSERENITKCVDLAWRGVLLGEGVGSLERRFSFARLPEFCFGSASLRFDKKRTHKQYVAG